MWQRFVNADSKVTSNIFAYCCNRPTTMIDENGKEGKDLFTTEQKERIKSFFNIFMEIFPREPLPGIQMARYGKVNNVFYFENEKYIRTPSEKLLAVNDFFDNVSSSLAMLFAYAFSCISYIAGRPVDVQMIADEIDPLLSIGTYTIGETVKPNPGHTHTVYQLYIESSFSYPCVHYLEIEYCSTGEHDPTFFESVESGREALIILSKIRR